MSTAWSVITLESPLLRLAFRSVDRLCDKAFRFIGVAPSCKPDPLATFKVLVVREEVLDLAPRNFRQIGVVHHVRVALRQLRYRNGNNLLVTAPSSVILSTPIGRTATTAPGMIGRVLATSMSQGSPSAERVWGMKP
jgi:hypothetical protein